MWGMLNSVTFKVLSAFSSPSPSHCRLLRVGCLERDASWSAFGVWTQRKKEHAKNPAGLPPSFCPLSSFIAYSWSGSRMCTRRAGTHPAQDGPSLTHTPFAHTLTPRGSLESPARPVFMYLDRGRKLEENPLKGLRVFLVRMRRLQLHLLPSFTRCQINKAKNVFGMAANGWKNGIRLRNSSFYLIWRVDDTTCSSAQQALASPCYWNHTVT